MSSRERVDRKELFPLAHHHHHQRILNTDTQLICKIIKCNMKMTFFYALQSVGIWNALSGSVNESRFNC